MHSLLGNRYPQFFLSAKPSTYSTTLTSPSHHQLQYSVSMNLTTLLLHLSIIILYVFVTCLSSKIISMAYDRFLPFLRLNKLVIHSSDDKHSNCFQFLAILITAMNIGLQISLQFSEELAYCFP